MSLSSTQQGFFYGLLVSAILTVGGYLSLHWAMSRSHNIFLRVLLGGMLARLAIIGGIMVWVWKFSTWDAPVFTVSLLGSYVVFQVIEVVIAQKQVRSRRFARPAGE